MNSKFVFGIFTIMMLVATSGFADPVNLDATQKKKLNVFFSNFSEAYVESFSQSTLSDQQIVDFALRHNYINRFNSLKWDAARTSVIVPSSQVDITAMKYLGRKAIRHQSSSYLVPLADGEAYRFSQLDHLQSLGANRFKATGTIYSCFDAGVNPHGSRADWQRANIEVDTEQKFTAIIQLEGDRYILLEYMLSDA